MENVIVSDRLLMECGRREVEAHRRRQEPNWYRRVFLLCVAVAAWRCYYLLTTGYYHVRLEITSSPAASGPHSFGDPGKFEEDGEWKIERREKVRRKPRPKHYFLASHYYTVEMYEMLLDDFHNKHIGQLQNSGGATFMIRDQAVDGKMVRFYRYWKMGAGKHRDLFVLSRCTFFGVCRCELRDITVANPKNIPVSAPSNVALVNLHLALRVVFFGAVFFSVACGAWMVWVVMTSGKRGPPLTEQKSSALDLMVPSSSADVGSSPGFGHSSDLIDLLDCTSDAPQLSALASRVASISMSNTMTSVMDKSDMRDEIHSWSDDPILLPPPVLGDDCGIF